MSASFLEAPWPASIVRTCASRYGGVGALALAAEDARTRERATAARVLVALACAQGALVAWLACAATLTILASPELRWPALTGVALLVALGAATGAAWGRVLARTLRSVPARAPDPSLARAASRVSRRWLLACVALGVAGALVLALR